jgi:hypothetical protein
MKKWNEENACNAFIRILNAITGLQYTKHGSPDELNRNRRDVDFILASDTARTPKMAVEHTIIESFEGQIGYVNRSHSVVESINAKCRGKIPTDRYYFLAFPPTLVDSLVGDSRKQCVNSLSPWVVAAGGSLHINNCAETNYEGHKITLMCMGNEPELNGNVWRMPTRPENQGDLLRRRLRRGIRDKLPKLSEYKKSGFETALLLEDIAGGLLGSGQGGKGMTGSQKACVEINVDYIVVFASRNERMIVGAVWKEKSVWHSHIRNGEMFSLLPST